MKIKTLLTTSLCCFLTQVNAGAMGPTSTEPPAIINPFVGIEGSYTWNSMYPGKIYGIQTTRNEYNWGGRASGGVALKRSETTRFTGEVGWGSYGHNNFDVVYGESSSYYFYGFDLLLGAVYSYGPVDFFAKAGAMSEILQGNINVNVNKYLPGGLYNGHQARSLTNTAVLPEIKVGGEYNVYNNLAISLSYMYVFGSNQSIFVDNYAAPGNVNMNQQFSAQAPSFNSIMLGLRYYI